MFGSVWAHALSYSAIKLYFPSIRTYVITVPERYRRTDNLLSRRETSKKRKPMCMYTAEDERYFRPRWTLNVIVKRL